MSRSWEEVKPLIEAALEYQDTHNITDVERELANDRAQLWCGKKSALITQVEDHPRGKKVRVWLAGGDLGELRRAALEGEQQADGIERHFAHPLQLARR